MITCTFFLISLALLFVPVDSIALLWGEFPSWKFALNVFTHMLGHGNAMHFLGNYMVFLPYGLILEEKLGPKAYTSLFVACGLTGVVFQVLFAPYMGVGLIGSSAAGFGVMTAALLAQRDKPLVRIACGILAAMLLLNQLSAASGPFLSNIAYWGHIGGAVCGLFWMVYQGSKSSSDSNSGMPRNSSCSSSSTRTKRLSKS